MFAFGHLALPLAAIIALLVLFIGAKLFFLSPSDNGGSSSSGTDTTASTSDRTGNGNTASPRDDDPLRTDTDPTQTQPGSTSSSDGLYAGPIGSDGSTGTSASGGEQTASTPSSGSQGSGQSGRTSGANTPSRSSSTGSLNVKFGVQVGAFLRAEGAEALMEEMTKSGYKAAISVGESSGKTYHRVRVAAGDNRAEAEKMAAELKKKYPVLIVTNP